MEKLFQYGNYALMVLGALVPVATVLVRLPFLKKYEKAASKFEDYVYKAMSFLPTLGKNPSTKALEEKVNGKKS